MERSAQEVAPRWQDTPPDAPGRSGRIMHLRAGQTRRVVVCSTRLTGVCTHYLMSALRTVPCTAIPSRNIECHVDHLRTSVRWQGWIAVQDEAGRTGEFLSITPLAARDCPYLLQTAESLRGLVIELTRLGKSRAGRMRATVIERLSSKVKLHAEPDVKEFLRNLWGPALREARLDQVEREKEAFYDRGQVERRVAE